MGFQCAGCGNDRFEEFFRGRDRLQGGTEYFTLWRCLVCGTVFQYPQPPKNRILKYYPEDYLAYTPEQATGLLARWSSSYGISKQIRAVLKKAPSRGKVLDVGCGEGGFIAGMNKRGWSAYGLEINPRIASVVHRRHGLDIILADSLDQAYASATFDLITFWDVLEHLSDPRLGLREAARIARPGALLILSLPNPDSLEAHLFGSSWAGWDLPRHLWLFPSSVLRRILNEEGWHVQEIRTFRGRNWLLAQTIGIWLADKPMNPRLKKIIKVFLGSWMGKIILLPYFSLIEMLKKGSIMVFFAQKR